MLTDELEDFGLLLGLGGGRDREVLEGDAVATGEAFKFRVIGHDQRHLDGELAYALTVEEIIEAVPNLGDHDENPRLAARRLDLVVHAIFGCQSVKRCDEMRRGRRGLLATCCLVDGEVHTHEEALGDGVTVLLQIGNVVLVGGEDAGHGVDDAGTVGAGEGEDVVLG